MHYIDTLKQELNGTKAYEQTSEKEKSVINKHIFIMPPGKYVYPAAGHVITGNLKIISDSRIRSIIAKGPKYSFPVKINFQKCREKIAASLNENCNRWCKREHVECVALKDWKLNIFKIIDRRISFYSQNTNMLPRKPKISFRHLKLGIQEFHGKYVLAPADKAANNVVV